MNFADFVSDGGPFLFFGLINHIGMIDALHRTVGRNTDHIQLINFPELFCFRDRGTGHPGQLVV